MTPRPLDTTPTSWSAYNAVLDGLDGAARVGIAIDLSEAVREIRLAGIRGRHPELSRREAVVRLVAEDYGVDLEPSP